MVGSQVTRCSFEGSRIVVEYDWRTVRRGEGKKKEEARGKVGDAHDVCRGTSQKWTRDIRESAAISGLTLFLIPPPPLSLSRFLPYTPPFSTESPSSGFECRVSGS